MGSEEEKGEGREGSRKRSVLIPLPILLVCGRMAIHALPTLLPLPPAPSVKTDFVWQISQKFQVVEDEFHTCVTVKQMLGKIFQS